MNTLTIFGKNLAREIANNGPAILTGLGTTGLFTTVVLAVGATPKAMALIDDEVYELYKREKKQGETFNEWLGLEANDPYGWSERVKMLKRREIVKLTWKCYIPTIAVGAITAACIIGANNINTRRNAALASLYTLTENAFTTYKEKVVETLGKTKELKVRDEIAQDEIRRNPVSGSEIIFTGKGETLCYDSLSGRYFKTDIERIRRIQNELNRDLMTEMFISLNEFYDRIGLSHIILGEENGWHINKDLLDITFTAALTEEDQPCLVLNYEVVPRLMYD